MVPLKDPTQFITHKDSSDDTVTAVAQRILQRLQTGDWLSLGDALNMEPSILSFENGLGN